MPGADDRPPRGGTSGGSVSGSDTAVESTRLLARVDEMAAQRLEGIEDAARTLVESSGGGLAVVSAARRLAVARVEADPSIHNKQVLALIRRAIELGMFRWQMDDTHPVP